MKFTLKIILSVNLFARNDNSLFIWRSIFMIYNSNIWIIIQEVGQFNIPPGWNAIVVWWLGPSTTSKCINWINNMSVVDISIYSLSQGCLKIWTSYPSLIFSDSETSKDIVIKISEFIHQCHKPLLYIFGGCGSKDSSATHIWDFGCFCQDTHFWALEA